MAHCGERPFASCCGNVSCRTQDRESLMVRNLIATNTGSGRTHATSRDIELPLNDEIIPVPSS